MRFIKCPGLWHLKLSPHSPYFNPKALKVLAGSLLFTSFIFLIFYLIVENHSTWRRKQSHYQQSTDGTDNNSGYQVKYEEHKEDDNLNYGIVIDCGSSGSRVFVYFWPAHDGNPHDLLNIQQLKNTKGDPVVKKVEPGISSFADNTGEASESIIPLLRFAAKHIPKSKYSETPLYVMATAGMRMLDERSQDLILDDLRVDIPMVCDFLFSSTHVEVISGKQEGIYAWIGLNYALGKFDHMIGDDPIEDVSPPGEEESHHIRKRTIGVIEMGGGSLQIAYEVPKSVSFISTKEEAAKGLLAEFNLGCTESDSDHKYRLYVTTFLGFGANSARVRYEDMLLSSVTLVNTTITEGNTTQIISKLSTILDPCLPVNKTETLTSGEQKYSVLGTGDFSQCHDRLIPLLNLTVPCMKEPCSVNGVFQPEINYQNSEFYGFSEYYYSMEDILKIAGKYRYSTFTKAAADFCGTKYSILKDRYDKNYYPKADKNRFRLQCFKSAWVTAVLHEGLRFPKSYRFLTSAQMIDGKEIQWTLGALLYKTRYFPLRELEKGQAHHKYNRAGFEIEIQYTYWVLLMCLLIVVISIFIYLRRLRIVRPPTLTRVSTYQYFMTEEGQAQDGVTVYRDQTFPYSGFGAS